LDSALVHVHLVGLRLDGGLQLLAAQLQRAFDGGNPVARFRRQVAEQPQRDLHKGDGLDNQERHCPVPQPPRGKPDGTEQAGKQVEGRA
jgi:hypothetical protein